MPRIESKTLHSQCTLWPGQASTSWPLFLFFSLWSHCSCWHLPGNPSLRFKLGCSTCLLLVPENHMAHVCDSSLAFFSTTLVLPCIYHWVFHLFVLFIVVPAKIQASFPLISISCLVDLLFLLLAFMCIKIVSLIFFFFFASKASIWFLLSFGPTSIDQTNIYKKNRVKVGIL